MRYLLEYLRLSRENLIGEVQSTFARWEFQDASGNLPHLHCLMKMKSSASIDEIRDNISCATTTAYDLNHGLYLCPATLKKIKGAGLAQTWEECREFLRD